MNGRGDDERDGQSAFELNLREWMAQDAAAAWLPAGRDGTAAPSC
ncbi:hypothetical protein [Streptomyces sp. APSN-46.1]|nr:hypothetical protein [Streptomyces sp. APSN-46.1]